MFIVQNFTKLGPKWYKQLATNCLICNKALKEKRSYNQRLHFYNSTQATNKSTLKKIEEYHSPND